MCALILDSQVRATHGESSRGLVGVPRHVPRRWTLSNFVSTMHGVPPESDPLAAFRAELTHRREVRGLTPTEAARRAGITGQRWRNIERGWETKQGVQIRANPRRDNLIKMAQAVGWKVSEALATAGDSLLSVAESRRVSSDPREELLGIVADLSNSRVLALLYVAQAMADPDAPIPVVHNSSPEGGAAADEMVVIQEVTPGSGAGDSFHQQRHRDTRI